MKYEFPAGFWWGSAASGPQTEGTVARRRQGGQHLGSLVQAEPGTVLQSESVLKTHPTYTIATKKI